MKFLKIFCFLALVCHSALANVASEYEGVEVDCTVNASFVKKASGKKSDIDLRITLLPVLKLSGKQIVMPNEGVTIDCANNYGQLVDGNLIVSACSNHKDGESPKIEKIKFRYTEQSDDRAQNYFCIPNKNQGKSSNNSGAPKVKSQDVTN